MRERFLEFTQLGKSYDTPHGPAVIVKDFNLRMHEGEFVCIIGHSGCGKSTVLSIVMGLNEPTQGGVILGGREISGPGTDRGVVFQSPALLPWCTARDNVLLAVQQVNGAQRRSAQRSLAEHYLGLVGLAEVGDCYPTGLNLRVSPNEIFQLLALTMMLAPTLDDAQEFGMFC
jgi:nitrate/nitrite transport system ATP-binding protein